MMAARPGGADNCPIVTVHRLSNDLDTLSHPFDPDYARLEFGVENGFQIILGGYACLARSLSAALAFRRMRLPG